MAVYSSYKKIDGSSLPPGSVTAGKLNATGLDTWNVKWVYGNPVPCSTGCCCLWTVPTGVARAKTASLIFRSCRSTQNNCLRNDR